MYIYIYMYMHVYIYIHNYVDMTDVKESVQLTDVPPDRCSTKRMPPTPVDYHSQRLSF